MNIATTEAVDRKFVYERVYFVPVDYIQSRGGTTERFFRNFERPSTPPNQLQLASNFVKTCFRRSPTFYFSTSNFFFRTCFGLGNPFCLLIQSGFGRDMDKWTSGNDSLQFFAPDGPIMSPVRPKIVQHMIIFCIRRLHLTTAWVHGKVFHG